MRCPVGTKVYTCSLHGEAKETPHGKPALGSAASHIPLKYQHIFWKSVAESCRAKSACSRSRGEKQACKLTNCNCCWGRSPGFANVTQPPCYCTTCVDCKAVGHYATSETDGDFSMRHRRISIRTACQHDKHHSRSNLEQLLFSLINNKSLEIFWAMIYDNFLLFRT